MPPGNRTKVEGTEMNINDFDKVYILQVDKRYEQRHRLIKMLINARVQDDKWRPFICQSYPYKSILKLDDKFSFVDPPPQDCPPFGGTYPSYCAFRAYQAIIKEAKQKNYLSILILEDDCQFTANFTEVLDKVKLSQGDWDLLYLGANHSWSPTWQVQENLLKIRGSVCWHAIGLYYSIYDVFLNCKPSAPIDLQATRLVHNNPLYECYAVWPSVAIQLPGFSHVEGRIRDYSEFWGCKGNPCLNLVK
jgi:hypothetical protein